MPFETRRPGLSSESNEPYAAIYASMLGSVAFLNLSHGAQALYVFMKLQYKNKQNGAAGLQPDQFYFNQAMYEKYGFTNPTQFQKYKKELIQQGFIKVDECGRTTRTKNIYSFSDEWQKVKKTDK